MYYFCVHGSHVCTLSESPKGRAHRRPLLYNIYCQCLFKVLVSSEYTTRSGNEFHIFTILLVKKFANFDVLVDFFVNICDLWFKTLF